MDYLHTPQIKVTCRSYRFITLSMSFLSVTPLAGWVINTSFTSVGSNSWKFPSDTAVELLVAGLLVPQAVADALGNIIGTQEHDTAFLLQLVVQADEIVEHRFGSVCPPRPNTSRGASIWMMSSNISPHTSRILYPSVRVPTVRAISRTKSPFFMSLRAEDIENLLMLLGGKHGRWYSCHNRPRRSRVTLRQRCASGEYSRDLLVSTGLHDPASR